MEIGNILITHTSGIHTHTGGIHTQADGIHTHAGGILTNVGGMFQLNPPPIPHLDKNDPSWGFVGYGICCGSFDQIPTTVFE